MASFYKSSKSSGFFSELKQIIFILLVVFLIRTFVFGLYQVPTGSMETTMLVGERFFADKFTYLFSKPQRGHVISLNSPLYKYSDNWFKRLFEEYVWGPQNLTKRIIGLPGDIVEGKVEDGKPMIYINGEKLDEPYLNKYPLIGVWRQDPRKLEKTVRDEAISLMSQNQLTPQQFHEYFTNELYRNIVQKSFDPAISYADQPFYRINESLILKDNEGKPLLTYPATAPDVGYDTFKVTLGSNQYWLMGDNRLNSGDSRKFGPVDGHLIHGRILFRIISIDSDEDWTILDLIKHPIDFWSRVRWGRFFQWIY
jgi:signal peptidase I